MSGEKLRVAIASLGCMGARHALHIPGLTPRAQLIAASTPDPLEIEWAKKALPGVRLCDYYDEMLRQELKHGLQAVVIVSATAVNADQAIKAINPGFHILCESP